MELRFFEIYRRSEYVFLLLEGAAFSIVLNLAAAFIGFAFALVLSGVTLGTLRRSFSIADIRARRSISSA